MTLLIDVAESTWTDVCALDDIQPCRGVAAMVEGHQVAIFRVSEGCTAAAQPGQDELFALSNFDPFSRAFVLSRGIVGSKGDRLKVASPVYKQSFDLRTGHCLDNPEICLPTFAVRAVDGRVQVAAAQP